MSIIKRPAPGSALLQQNTSAPIPTISHLPTARPWAWEWFTVHLNLRPARRSCPPPTTTIPRRCPCVTAASAPVQHSGRLICTTIPLPLPLTKSFHVCSLLLPTALLCWLSPGCIHRLA